LNATKIREFDNARISDQKYLLNIELSQEVQLSASWCVQAGMYPSTCGIVLFFSEKKTEQDKTQIVESTRAGVNEFESVIIRRGSALTGGVGTV